MNHQTFESITSKLYLSAGDKFTQKFWVYQLTENTGCSRPDALKICRLVVSSGRVVNGVVVTAKVGYEVDGRYLGVIAIVKAVLVALGAESGLSTPLIDALQVVTGLPFWAIQHAFDCLSNDGFMVQHRAVNPAQYVARKWE